MAFNFGGANNSGFSFGSTSTSKATGTATPFSLGTKPTTTASTGFSLNTGGFGNKAGTSTGFSLGGTPAATTAPSSGFGSGFKFGSSTATSTAAAGLGPGTGFALGGSLGGGLSVTTTASSLTAISTETAKPAFKGLGGVSSTASSSSQNENGNRSNGVSQALKDQQVPDELCKDIEQFGQFVKKQKEDSGEVGKFSVRSLHKIREEVTSLSYALGTVSSALHRNNAAVQKLRVDFTQELRHIEMSQQTKDIPPSLQHDNIAPVKFFMNMVMEFEASMQIYRRQIEELENHLNSYHQTTNLTAQDIYMALCKMQESFISLAANLHSIHDQVKHLKEQYLIYRRIVHGETADIFAENRQKSAKAKLTQTTGLSPFNQLSNVAALAMASMVNQQRQQQQGPPQQGFLSTQPLGGTGLFGSTSKPTGAASLFGGAGSTGGSLSAGTSGSKFGGFGGFGSTAKPLSAGFGTATSSTSLFGNSPSLNTSAGLTFGGSASGSTFELKRPPAGNKRGKK